MAQARSFLQLTFLLAVFAATWPCTSQASRILPASAHSQSGPHVIRAELLHRDHPNSPLAPTNGALVSLADGIRRYGERRPRLRDVETPVELKGGFRGQYVMTIEFGTPPQKFTGLVDTGSDLVWIQCVPCPGCTSFTQPGLPYNPGTSSSEVYVSCNDHQCADFTKRPAKCDANTNYTCGVEYEYADGSQIEGTLTTETLTLSDATSVTSVTGFVMGCMNNNTGIFDNYDGIIGFGRGKYSLPAQLSAHGFQEVFAYCLVPYTATTTLASPLLFGTKARGLVYTPLLAFGDTNFYVNMTGISVNGQPVPLARELFKADAAGVLFDSGTPITRFFPEVYQPFRDAITSVVNVTYPEVYDPSGHYCFNITGVQSPVHPRVTFHYGGVDGVSIVDFDLGPENVFGPYTVDPGVTCLAFRSTTDEEMTIGSVNQANHYIETDVAKMRMGWTTKDCTIA